MNLRPAGLADSAALAALATELGYPAVPEAMAERLRTLQPDERQLIIVAEHRGGVAGWIHASDAVTLESGRRVEILGLVVAGPARRSGIGRALVDAAASWARERGATQLVVRSNVERRESHAFYPALGFAPVKRQAIYRKQL